MLNKHHIITILALLTLLITSSAFATEYPAVINKNTQIVYIKDPAVDHATTIAAFNRAKVSITIFTHVFSAEPLYGLPLMNAAWNAAARGVKVRVVTTKLGSLVADFWNKLRRVLSDSYLPDPPEIIVFGGFSNIFRRMKFTDTNHEKMTVIDADTPDEVIFFKGRNYDQFSLRNFDLGFVLRPIDPSQEYAGTYIKQLQAELWSVLSKIQKPFKPKFKKTSHLLTGDAEPTTLLITQDQRDQFIDVQRLLAGTPNPEAPKDIEFYPEFLQTISNDFFHSLISQKILSTVKRLELIQSDNHKKAVEIIQNAKEISIALMVFYLPEAIKDALITAAKNGAEIDIYTNSYESSKIHAPRGALYKNGLKDMGELMEAGALSAGNIRIHALKSVDFKKPNLESPTNQYFTHRKLIVADDHVLFGSDNYSINSQIRNSEVVMLAKDKRLSEALKSQLVAEQEYYEELSCETALTGAKYYRWNPIDRLLNLYLRRFY